VPLTLPPVADEDLQAAVEATQLFRNTTWPRLNVGRQQGGQLLYELLVMEEGEQTIACLVSSQQMQ
jgi:hypothetical protein